MTIEILYNPAVIGAIIGAIVGAITSAILALIISQFKFNKRKNGAKALIKSEINYIVNDLDKFRGKYLKEEIKDVDKNISLLFNFYNALSNFPIWTNRNWINLISFIPSIFKGAEIDKINQFYAKCDELTNVVNALADKEPPNLGAYMNGEIEAKELPSFKTINDDRTIFRNDLNELIKLGEEIKLIFH